MTKQKLIISQIVETSHNHPTAEEIYMEAKKQIPSIAVGTVYRNLNRMVEDGEIRRISIPGKPDHYDQIRIKHSHIWCIRCGKISDVENGLWVQLPDPLPENAKLLDYELLVKCLCSECQAVSVSATKL